MFKEKVKLLDKREICDGVVELEFTKPEGFEFKVGQYCNLYMAGAEVAHGKSYTIISSNKEKNLCFSVRKRGPFSTYLHNLKVGDEMILEGPEGLFLFEDYKDGLIFIGAGIGIAPLVNYLKYLEDSNQTDLVIKVLFTNKSELTTPYVKMLKDAKVFKNLETKFFYTANGGKRIDEESVKKVIEGNNLPIFLCGSINFTYDFWKMLRRLDIADERIITEAFF